MNRICHNCGREVGSNEQLYVLRIELFAKAEPLELTIDDLLADHTAQIEKLIEEMEALDPEEASDEVYESYNFELCPECRRRVHHLLKGRAKSHKVQ
ncbi:MAG: hypothetical protein N2Z21_03415 [Candidatus Sumerlaeaceae bacterium]|nr:hypothetical protein [Candidatus Sumerlaeaceae bacterium]